MPPKKVEVGFYIDDHPELGDVDGEKVAEIATKAVMAAYLGNGVLRNWYYTVESETPRSHTEDSPPLPE